MKDYYYILGLKQSASIQEIKVAYRKLSHKFHPDKNEGDDFFTERFKEIQEAYETLSDPISRANFDNQKSRKSESKQNNEGTNFMPDVEYFTANKSTFEFNEEVTFSWKTINADKVILKPFGAVEPIGQKTYKLKDFKNASLTFELFVENTGIGRQVKSSVTLRNKTFQELYEFFKNKINEDSTKKTNHSQNHQTYNNHNVKQEIDETDKETKQIWVGAIIAFIIILIILIVNGINKS